jgi:hypothetical protein
VLAKHRYGFPTRFEDPSTIVATKDGGSLITARRHSAAEEVSLIVKLTPNGSVDWARKFPAQQTFYQAAMEASDGGFALMSWASYSSLTLWKLSINGKIGSCGVRGTKVHRKKFSTAVGLPDLHFNRKPPARSMKRPFTARKIDLSETPDCL